MAEQLIQDENKREEDAERQFDVTAQVTINKGYRLPLTKLSLSGTVRRNQDEDASTQIVQRSILFVIDRSGSMVSALSICC